MLAGVHPQAAQACRTPLILRRHVVALVHHRLIHPDMRAHQYIEDEHLLHGITTPTETVEIGIGISTNQTSRVSNAQGTEVSAIALTATLRPAVQH